MTDKREAILARLVVVARETAGVKSAVRNMLNPTDSTEQLPIVIVYEGDEEPSPAVVDGRQVPAGAPVPIVMLPQVCIIANAASKTIGTDLNLLRAALIKAVVLDSELITLARSAGSIAYRGLVSDFGLGRTPLGHMALRFAISYVLQPTRL